MSDIRFQSDQFGPGPQRPGDAGLAAWLVKKGIAADRRSAEYILVGTAVIALIVMLIAWNWGDDAAEIPPASVWERSL